MEWKEEFDLLRTDYTDKTMFYLNKLKDIQAKDFQRSNLTSEMALLHAETTSSYMALVKMMIVLKNN